MKVFFFFNMYCIKCWQCPFRVKNILDWKRIIFKVKRTVKGEKKRWRGEWGDVEEKLWIGNFIRIGFFLFVFWRL